MPGSIVASQYACWPGAHLLESLGARDISHWPRLPAQTSLKRVPGNFLRSDSHWLILTPSTIDIWTYEATTIYPTSPLLLMLLYYLHIQFFFFFFVSWISFSDAWFSNKCSLPRLSTHRTGQTDSGDKWNHFLRKTHHLVLNMPGNFLSLSPQLVSFDLQLRAVLKLNLRNIMWTNCFENIIQIKL